MPTFDITSFGFTPSDTLSLTDVGNSIVLNGVSVIPEPAAALLCALGAMRHAGALPLERPVQFPADPEGS